MCIRVLYELKRSALNAENCVLYLHLLRNSFIRNNSEFNLTQLNLILTFFIFFLFFFLTEWVFALNTQLYACNVLFISLLKRLIVIFSYTTTETRRNSKWTISMLVTWILAQKRNNCVSLLGLHEIVFCEHCSINNFRRKSHVLF